jgi:YjbE family integral membrane protein
MDIAGVFTPEGLSALFQVVMVDLVMAGDNAIIVGMAAAGLPSDLRRKAIVIGIAAATVLRILFSAVTVQLLAIIGLTLAGGLLLAWVAWKMWREIQSGAHKAEEDGERALEGEGPESQGGKPKKSLRDAVIQIIVADVSMSLDNVLAVAGASRDHPIILVFGLALSVALMAVASTFIARMLKNYHWLAYVGLVIVAYIAGRMIYDGAHEVIRAAAL